MQMKTASCWSTGWRICRYRLAIRTLPPRFDLILNEQFAALTKTDIQTRCKVLLLQQLTSGEPSEEELASQVQMSCRTLQRKLADSGLTYNRLLDETRYEMAQRYLNDPHRSVTEITFLLGFSEQSAFTRAFKRWSQDGVPQIIGRSQAQCVGTELLSEAGASG